MSVVRKVRDLIAHEPVVVRTAIGLIVSLGLVWGVDLTNVGEQVAQTADLVGALVLLLGVAWARQGATPAVEVVVTQEPSGALVAGPASAQTTGSLIDETRPLS